MRVIEHLEEHYEVQEVPFGRVYKWCPKSAVVECDCGESTILKISTLISSVVFCHCGADYTADIQEECQRHQPEVLGQTLEDYETVHHPCVTTPKPRRNNIYETRMLILRTRPGATTMDETGASSFREFTF